MTPIELQWPIEYTIAYCIGLVLVAAAQAWLRKLRDAEGKDAMLAVIAEAERLRNLQDWRAHGDEHEPRPASKQ